MKAMTINPATSTITLSSAFKKKAFTPGTSEYAEFMAVRREFPDYKLAVREFKTNTKQDRYKGLTYPFMREYIAKVEGENAKPVLDGLDYMIDISKCHSTCKRYPVVKKWFLNRYPDVETFGMTDKELAEWTKKKAAAASNSETEKKEQDASATESANVTEFPASEQENSQKESA